MRRGGGGAALAFAVITVYLIVSRKKSGSYSKILEDGTTVIDLTETLALTKTLREIESPQGETVLETVWEQARTILDGTEVIPPPAADGAAGGETTGESRVYGVKFPAELLEKYIIYKELSGGGMSRVFIALNKKLQNIWIIKFIDKQNPLITSEEDILKRLNHTNLPAIADIFYSADGAFIVERFVEGLTLDVIIKAGQTPGQFTLLQPLQRRRRHTRLSEVRCSARRPRRACSYPRRRRVQPARRYDARRGGGYTVQVGAFNLVVCLIQNPRLRNSFP